jgi:hypothetical protein
MATTNGKQDSERGADDDEVGVHVKDVIDYVFINRDKREVAVVMIQQTPWSDPAKETLQLADKVNLYVEYVRSGQLFKDWPEARGKKVYLSIDTLTPPEGVIAKNIAKLQEIVAKHSLDLRVKVLTEDKRP